MAAPSRHEGEQHFADAVVFLSTVSMPNGSLGSSAIEAGAGVEATKLEHQFPVTYSQGYDRDAHYDRKVIHQVYGTTGTVVAIEAGVTEACTGTATVDIDLLKNGTSILSSALEIDSGDAALATVAGTISTSTTADGDVFELLVEPQGTGADTFEYQYDFTADAGDTPPDPWATDGQTANSTEDYVTDQGTGVFTLTQSSDSEAQAGQLFSGDNLWIDLYENPIIEFRAKLDLTGTNALGSADQRLVMGVGSNHTNAEDALDSVTTSAWFRMEGASANIYVEADDNSTNTDDQDSGYDLSDNTWTDFKIDFSTLSDVKFYVNGAEQTGSTVTMANVSSSTLVQPIFCIQRDAGAEEEKIYIDHFKVTSSRSSGTHARGVYCTVFFREDAT